MNGDLEMDASWTGYWHAYAEGLAQPLQNNGLVSRFVTNGNVTGAFAEAWIRSMAKSMLGRRFRVSTGAVVRPYDQDRGLDNVAQCDLIVWDPSELPGLFECGDFAPVPYAAARAVVEIKRTCSEKMLRDQLAKLRELVPSYRVLGIVLSHPKALFDRVCRPDWLTLEGNSLPLTRILDQDDQPDLDGIMAAIYFFAQLAGHTNLVAPVGPPQP